MKQKLLLTLFVLFTGTIFAQSSPIVSKGKKGISFFTQATKSQITNTPVLQSEPQVLYMDKIPSANPGKATITLKDNNAYYGFSESGFVLLFGKNLNMENSLSTLESNYIAADYKIPQNSAYDGNNVSSFISGTSNTIEIEAGNYSYRLLAVEQYEPAKYILSETAYPFENGWEYTFTTRNNGVNPVANLEVKQPADAAFELPFTDNFTAPYSTQWRIIDANSDGTTWEQSNLNLFPSPDANSGAMLYRGLGKAANDYLITKLPVSLPAGNNYFKILYAAGESPESFRIYYGTTNNLAQLTPLGEEIHCNQSVWSELSLPIHLDVAGKYYFAIKATSSSPDNWLLAVSNVVIDIARPDLTITSIESPVSGCNESSETPVGFRIYNAGYLATSSFSVNYNVAGNTGDKNFSIDIAPKETATVYLDNTFNFSLLQEYKMMATVNCADDLNHSNDTATVAFTTSAPVQLPVRNFLLKEEDGQFFVTKNPDEWVFYAAMEYDEHGAIIANAATTLYTKCFEATPNNYNIRFNYYAGFNIPDFVTLSENFDVRVGKSSSDIVTWNLITSFEDEYTNDDFALYEGSFTIDEAGEYRIAFIPKKINVLAIGSLEISEMFEHDIEMRSISSSFAPYTPVNQWDNAKVDFSVSLKNIGRNAEDLHVQLLRETAVLGDQSVHLEANNSTETLFSVRFTDIKSPQTIDLMAKALLDSDNDLSNNALAYTLTATDSTFATENLVVENLSKTKGIGVTDAQEPIIIGNVFTLNKADKLVSITALFLKNEDFKEGEIGLSVYSLGEKRVDGSYPFGATFYQAIVSRPEEGFRTWTIPDSLSLPAGAYYLAVIQLAEKNIAIAVDGSQTGYFYSYSEDEESRPIVERIFGFGNVAVRANFTPYIDDKESIALINQVVDVYFSNNTLYVNADQPVKSIVVSDVKGCIVHQSAGLNKIDANKWERGVYIGKVATADSVKTVKFIVR